MHAIALRSVAAILGSSVLVLAAAPVAAGGTALVVPTVDVVSPIEGAVVGPSFTLEASVRHEGPVDIWLASRSGIAIEEGVAAGALSWDLDSSEWGDGAALVSIQAREAGMGDIAPTTAVRRVVVDLTAPVVGFESPEPEARVIQGNVLDVIATTRDVHPSAAVLFLDDQEFSSVDRGAGDRLEFSVPTGGLALGPHSITFAATDLVGNHDAGSMARMTFVVESPVTPVEESETPTLPNAGDPVPSVPPVVSGGTSAAQALSAPAPAPAPAAAQVAPVTLAPAPAQPAAPAAAPAPGTGEQLDTLVDGSQLETFALDDGSDQSPVVDAASAADELPWGLAFLALGAAGVLLLVLLLLFAILRRRRAHPARR